MNQVLTYGQPGPPPRDVDVLVVGDADEDDLFDVARSAERTLGREVNLGSILRPFDRLGRRQNQAEHPSADGPGFVVDDVDRDLSKVREMADAAAKVLDQMSPY